MKNLKYTFLLFLGLGVIAIGCDSEDDLIEERIAETTPTPPTFSSGDADFTNYVALGNSLTAGFMDGALYDEGQMNSFPNIIGQQMVEAGLAADFNQPDINSVNGFNSTFSNVASGVIAGKTILDTSIPGPVPTFPGELLTPFGGNKGELNNFGVPGARTRDLITPGYGFPDVGNPFFNRFATDPSTTSVLADALATNPTFYTLWIGSNDVLGYALSGGVGPDPLDVYSQGDFTADYSNMIGQLAATGSEGVVINIPPVLLIPFLRAVSWDAIELDAATAEDLNVGFVGFNSALDGIVAPPPFGLGHDADDADRRRVSYSAGANPVLVIDEELEDLGPKFDILLGAGAITLEQRMALAPYEQSRPLTEGELVLLSAGAVLGTEADGDDSDMTGPTPIGVAVPLGFDIFTGELSGDQWYLTLAEQGAIVTARATYSGVIAGIAAATQGVEMFDIQPLFADIAGLTPELAGEGPTTLNLTPAAVAAADGVQGLEFEGVTLAPDFSPAGIFSTDGVHPNPRGHAILSNELIHFINENFGSNIPTVNSTIYRTVLFQ